MALAAATGECFLLEGPSPCPSPATRTVDTSSLDWQRMNTKIKTQYEIPCDTFFKERTSTGCVRVMVGVKVSCWPSATLDPSPKPLELVD